jgi:hypothetical protein
MLAFRNDRFSPSGTDGSNPLSSSGESAANLRRGSFGAVVTGSLPVVRTLPRNVVASSWQASVLAPFYSRHPQCSMLMLFLLTFVSLKFPEVFRLTSRCRGVVVLGNRPRSFSGHSILMISAPKAPSQRVAHGPARTQLKSTTRVPARLFIWTPWYSTEFAHTHLTHRLESWAPPIWNADPPPGAWAFIRPVDPSVVAKRSKVGCQIRVVWPGGDGAPPVGRPRRPRSA